MKKEFLIIMLLSSSFLSIVAQQDVKIMKEEAWGIVQKNVLGGSHDNVNVYVLNRLMEAETSFKSTYGEEVSPKFDSWFFFIDDMPNANWEHPCRYVFVNSTTGEYHIYNKQRPPLMDDMMIPLIEKKAENTNEKLFKLDRFSSQNQKAGSLNYNHKYAIIISGGMNMTNNYERYWNDCSALYKVLKNYYGYSQDHIYVLMSDGTSPANDRHLNNGLYDSSPLDLDGDGINDIQYAATHSNLENVFNILSNVLTEEDNLFIFTTDHGGSSGNQHSYLYLWNEILHDYEFASYLNQLDAGIINVCMGQCYSGGFIDNITKDNVVVSTACRHDEVSYSMNSLLYDEYVYYWISAVADETPDGTPVNADTDQDGLVSMHEAFVYASYHDTANEHPQYNSIPSVLGQSTYLINSLSNITISGSTNIDNNNLYIANNLQNGMSVTWSINNPSFTLFPFGNTCSVTNTLEHQYNSALLTATISMNGHIIKTTSKQIYSLDDIEGNNVLCNSEMFNTIPLPDSLSVTWNIDNSLFSLITSGNQCTVSCTNYTQPRQANLTATISGSSGVLTTLTKEIYTHGTTLTISGTQEAYSSSLGYYPEQTFSYNATNAGSGYSSTNIIINADCDIVLESERFQGMEISFEGEGAPTNVQHNGSIVSFHTQPYSINYVPLERLISRDDDLKPLKPAFYPFTMQLRDEEGCSDFDLNFKVETLPFLNDSELQISTTSTTLYVHLLTAYAIPIGGGLYQQPTWYLSVINSQTGQIMTSKTVTGSDTTVNISSYSSGLYIVRAIHDGNIYSAKFIK